MKLFHENRSPRGDAEPERLFSGKGRSHLLENELAQRQDPESLVNL